MPLYKLYTKDAFRLGIWKLTETADELASLFPGGMQIRENAFKLFQSEGRRREWIAIRTLLYNLLKEQKEICYLPNGKPYLKDRSYHIGISHTRGFVALSLHSEHETGIDIEYHNKRIFNVRRRFITKEEERYILPQYELNSLLLHWCAKETVFKMMNTAEVNFLEHLHIEKFDYPIHKIFFLQETRTAEQKLYEIHYRIYPDFVITWSEQTHA